MHGQQNIEIKEPFFQKVKFYKNKLISNTTITSLQLSHRQTDRKTL